MSKSFWLGILYTLVIALCVAAIEAWLVMLLWNWIAVGLFNAPVLGFWTAFGLMMLCSVLFKSAVTITKKNR